MCAGQKPPQHMPQNSEERAYKEKVIAWPCSEARNEVHIGFWDYYGVGNPFTLLTLAVGRAWLRLVR